MRIALAVGLFGTGLLAGMLLQWRQPAPPAAAGQREHREKPRTADAPGWFVPADEPPRETGPTPDRVEQLQVLGYAQGSSPAPPDTGLLQHDPSRAYQGLNLYNSGHAAEAILMDMSGIVLHKWSLDFERLWPKRYSPKERGQQYFRKVRLLDNGDLVAIFAGSGLVRLDRDSNPVWAIPGNFHHDLRIAEDGRIFVLARDWKVVRRIHEKQPILEDSIVVLDPEGRMLEKISLLEAFERSDYAPFLENARPFGDIFHTNSVRILDGRLADRSEAFRRGNVLISIPRLDVIAIVDLAEKRIVWALSGMWHEQHDPVLLEDGKILLFDNFGQRGMSKVVEFDPFTQEVAWAYEGDPSNGFFSECCGTNQRLPNGNTLIAETLDGRVFEVTRDKTIVWEFLNPHRAGDDDELIAIIPEMIRLPSDVPLGWLRAGGTAAADAR